MWTTLAWVCCSSPSRSSGWSLRMSARMQSSSDSIWRESWKWNWHHRLVSYHMEIFTQEFSHRLVDQKHPELSSVLVFIFLFLNVFFFCTIYCLAACRLLKFCLFSKMVSRIAIFKVHFRLAIYVLWQPCLQFFRHCVVIIKASQVKSVLRKEVKGC